METGTLVMDIVEVTATDLSWLLRHRYFVGILRFWMTMTYHQLTKTLTQ
jgi:hypothetical protein